MNPLIALGPNNIFPIFFCLKATTILRIIVVNIIKLPNKKAATKTVLMVPKNGSLMVECSGFKTDSNSKPKKLPNSAQNRQEKNPAKEAMPARFSPFNLYSIKPPINRTSPWPKSPNIIPKIME